MSHKIIIIILIGVAFYAGILFYSDFERAELENIQINWNYLPIIFIITFSLMILSGMRYHLMLKELDVNIVLKESVLIALIGQSMLVTPGRIGNYIKCYILKKRYGTPLSISVPSVMAEQILELITATILLLILNFWFNFLETQIISIVGILLISFIIMLIYNSSIFHLGKRVFQKIKYIRKFSEDLETSRNSLKKLFAMSLMKKILPLSFTIKILQVFLIFLIFEMLDMNLGLLVSGVIYNTALLFGAISFIPGGIIVTDASMLSLIIKNGADFSLASVAVIIIRFFTLWLSVIIGFLAIKFSKISFNTD